MIRAFTPRNTRWRPWKFAILMMGGYALMEPSALAAGGHADPVTPVVLGLAILLMSAKLGGDLATRLGQPSVMGELVMGMILGNLTLVGWDGLEWLKHDTSIDMLARLGVMILLFEVGLESTVGQMMKVGVPSLMVALVGVVVPTALGFGVGKLLLPEHSIYFYLFLGATLCATSVGITARVLKDLGHHQSKEAHIILGAAVIDDVLGLVVLAVVIGLIAAADAGKDFNPGEAGMILAKAFGFLVTSIGLGVWLSPKLFKFASKLQSKGVLLALGLSFCFFLSWLAAIIGLAPIVGAFAAGLILEELHYESYKDKGDHQLEELIHPISAFLVPLFFMTMGMKVDLKSFMDVSVLGLAAGITVVAIIGKQVCGLVVSKDLNRMAIGVGMIPRGEVGLIFANIGLSLKVKGERIVDPHVFSAIVVMVMVTTMITPPILAWLLKRKTDPGGMLQEQVY